MCSDCQHLVLHEDFNILINKVRLLHLATSWWDCHGMYHGVTDYYRNLACFKIVHLSVLSSRYDNLNYKTIVNSLRSLVRVEGIMPVNRHAPFRFVELLTLQYLNCLVYCWH